MNYKHALHEILERFSLDIYIRTGSQLLITILEKNVMKQDLAFGFASRQQCPSEVAGNAPK